MKKVLDQTVRDIKREVNKKVLKIPTIEQKVLDATSNEPWGPHGTLLADIAHATRNYEEHLMIMAVIWKRINDTGKNWRHVYKALIVLEYLVANGSERVIDEIKERAYQISTLSSFQYIDSKGRDQGNNVRKKSQSLVALVNDKERLIEVRERAAASRDKFRKMSSFGGIYRSSSFTSSGGYDDDHYDGRYGSRDDDRSGYGYRREREWGYRDDDRYSRGWESSRDGEQYGKDSYGDDDYRGRRSRSIDGNQYGSRSQGSDRERNFDDDGQYSSRGSGAKAEDNSMRGRRLDRKFSEQFLDRKFSESSFGASPSYEEAVSEARSPSHKERYGYTPTASPPEAVSPSVNKSHLQETNAGKSQEFEASDDFDPRASIPAVNSMPPKPATASEGKRGANSGSGPTFVTKSSASNAVNQSFDDPFGDSPFKAIPSMEAAPTQPQNSASASMPHHFANQNAELYHQSAQKEDPTANYDLGNSLALITYPPSSFNNQSSSSNSQFLPQELSIQHSTGTFVGTHPPSGHSPGITYQVAFSTPTGEFRQQGANMYMSIPAQMDSTMHGASNMVSQSQSRPDQQSSSGGFYSPGGHFVPASQQMNAQFPSRPAAYPHAKFLPPQAYTTTTPVSSQMHTEPPSGPATNFNNSSYLSRQRSTVGAPFSDQMQSHPSFRVPARTSSGILLPPQGSMTHVTSQFDYQTPSSPITQNSNLVPYNFSQAGDSTSVTPYQNLSASTSSSEVPQSSEKFETKSAIWSDTLNRGLVNLNISGSKINPLADIGIDFDALNRKERMEKPARTSVMSTTMMGKAMGSGTGIGRSSASSLRPPPRPMMNAGMATSGNPGASIGVGGCYRAMQQQRMGGDMGFRQRLQTQNPGTLPPGVNAAGGYNPMMSSGGYNQQPYGSG